MEYKKFLSSLKPFSRYGGHKIRNFELFCWQHCRSDSLEILISNLLASPSCTECKMLHQNICNS
ncbi:hypothetical protein O3M35_010514 [Rhynocoris fuscipes]|uniref:Uncharacterized protein n=1 Tax=Rhynocoris fuscipes TaxID=488301 RepID=A0AAW1D0I1_9HEMI